MTLMETNNFEIFCQAQLQLQLQLKLSLALFPTDPKTHPPGYPATRTSLNSISMKLKPIQETYLAQLQSIEDKFSHGFVFPSSAQAQVKFHLTHHNYFINIFVGDSLPSSHFFTESVRQSVTFFQIN